MTDRTNPQRPSVGRIVHFRLADGEQPTDCQAAIITRRWSDTVVNLTVFTDNSVPVTPTSVAEGDGPRQWHWPERVQPFAEFDR